MTIQINYITDQYIKDLEESLPVCLKKDEFILVEDIPCVLDQMLAEYRGYV